MGEQSAIRAGDGGFDIHVKGDTQLAGGQITSNQAAVDSARNQFSTAGQNAQQALQSGSLTLSDIQNQASYQASSLAVGLGAGSQPNKPLTAGMSGAGYGQASGSASSTSSAGISGLAGDQAIRTTDKQTALAPILDAARVKADVQAQASITMEFGKQARKLEGDVVDDKLKDEPFTATGSG